MTDATLPVTQSAVERFTDRYLRSLDCTIEKNGDIWNVRVPETVDTMLPSGELTLICRDGTTKENGGKALHPESQFFQDLLGEASKRNPTGKITIDTHDSDLEIPGWLQQSPVQVEEVNFTPYYDRTAVIFLFQVGIETVSEYQTELLRAIALDARSEEPLPPLEETFLRTVSLDGASNTSTQSELTEGDMRPLLDRAQTEVVKRVQSQLDDIHHEASRAADAEVEDYRQMQQQRIQELEEKQSSLSSKIKELSERAKSSNEKERVQALKDRKELKSEYENVTEELKQLRKRREQGFPEKQQEIRTRHALDVQMSPLTLTEVEYERGEIRFVLVQNETSQTVTVGYGSGVGVTEDVSCISCNEKFSEENPLQTIMNGLRCKQCAQ